MIHGALGMDRSPWKSINGLREAHSGWQRQVARITMRPAIYQKTKKQKTFSDADLPIIKDNYFLESAVLERCFLIVPQFVFFYKAI